MRGFEKAEIQNCAAGIVDDEIFIAVTAAANGGTASGIDGALEGGGYVFDVFAEFDGLGGNRTGEAGQRRLRLFFSVS